ncbi:MAG TPA: hypothetical protein DC038_06370, partial [Clostridiales bacterium]|nr:hypothetical protein [Clostridiales bacterium]
SPEEINDRLGLSKSSFKKAAGRLMKKRMISMNSDGIRMVNEDSRAGRNTVRNPGPKPRPRPGADGSKGNKRTFKK